MQAVRLLHLLVRKVLILFLVLLRLQAVAVGHQAEMEMFRLLLAVLEAVVAAAVAGLLRRARRVHQVRETLVEMAVHLVKTIPAVVAVALVL